MSGLFTKKDGRLKTGRVAILIFAGLLVALGMLFKINSSVDHALLAVKHVFEPAAVEPVKEKPAVKKAIARVEPAKDKEAEQKRERLSDETRTEKKKKADPAPEKAFRNDEKSAPVRPPAKDTAKVEPETKSSASEKADAGQEVEKTLAEAAKKPPSDTRKQDRGRPVQKEESALDKAGRILAKQYNVAPEKELSVSGKPETDGRIVFDKAALAKIARKSSEREPGKPKSDSMRINLSEKLNRLTATSKQPIEKKQSEPSKPIASLPKKTFLDADPDKREVTVDQKQYKALFHSWRIAGKEGKGKEKSPLRVENLRNTYDLFQMKPVAVIRGNAFLDLSDGTRVSEKSLEEYSTTVFLVDRPWDKWGKALSAAGIRRGDRFEVRYYMYDFIKDAIYARVNQAFSWCSDTGLIPGDLPAGAVDVLGRAYVINRQGGGRFGVFVPVSLDTKDGRTVAVDPSCFRGQPDVDTLREAGVL
jgi:hypothetical protein